MSKRFVEIQTHGGVRELALNDEKSLNSLTEELSKDLLAELREAEADESIRSVIITGRGRMFSSGGNLKEFLSANGAIGEVVNRMMVEVYNPLAAHIRSMSIPVISLVNGPAIGAGVGLALCADLVYAVESATFSLPFVPKLGLVPDMGTSWLVARLLGTSKAMELTLTGREMSAAEAAAEGLVLKVLSASDAVQVVNEIAHRMAELPPKSVERTKKAINQARFNDFETQLELERELQVACFSGDEAAEGLNAFKERRQPRFVNC